MASSMGHNMSGNISSSSDSENISLQTDEIEALSAIYGDDFNFGSSDKDYTSFTITIRPDGSQSFVSQVLGEEARLMVTFQPGYPSSEPPAYEISIPWLSPAQKQLLAESLEEVCLEHWGESIVFIWVEKLRELLNMMESRTDLVQNKDFETSRNLSGGDGDAGGHDNDAITCAAAAGDPLSPNELIDNFSNSLSLCLAEDSCELMGADAKNEKTNHGTDRQTLQIHTGEPLTDRKSTFQAHVAPIDDVTQVKLVLEVLYENKKIAAATHNMFAYRILKADKKTWIQDCDDDGESQAGSRLLHLLQILDCRNVIVVVSRWYGGIQLHGDRFKHINNVARQTLVQYGFATDGKKLTSQSQLIV